MARLWLLMMALWLTAPIYAQSTGTVKGRVSDSTGNPLAGVNIRYAPGKGAVTGREGRYELNLAPGHYNLVFTYLGFETVQKQLQIEAGRTYVLNLRMRPKAETIGTIHISGHTAKEKEGATLLPLQSIELAPSPTMSIKNILISLPSVSQLDEMSSQYLVRGGNYDENAVYIDGMEVFRPYLIRSGRQEGLSVVNPSLIHSLSFYPGAFPVEMGDKLSSVLDIHYEKPRQNHTSLEAGFTGGNVAFFRKGNKWNAIAGLRYLNNTLLVRSMEGDAEYRPAFADFQSAFRYRFSARWEQEALVYLSLNRYRFVPFTKTTNFGTFTDAKSLVIRYEGQEKDAFDSQFMALITRYIPHKDIEWTWTNSFYHSNEREYFDILGSYYIGEPNTDMSGNGFGDPMNLQSLGAELDHARNDLDALRGQTELSLKWTKGRRQWSFGISGTLENIRDRLREYQVIDSAGFSVLPPGSEFVPDEPYSPDTLPLLPFQAARADYLNIRWHAGAYISYRNRLKKGDWKWDIATGIRLRYWTLTEKINVLSGQGFLLSPRLNLFVTNRQWPDHRFRLGTGIYMQPPSYREYRAPDGSWHPGIQPQKAWNISLAHAWTFMWDDFPFKLNTEIYYRYLWDVNPYTVENLRIRYYAKNNAIAYAYGIESRLFGRLLPGTDSWLSLAWMKTEQNIDGRGWIPRPTDQRFKMNLFFQDYVPGMPFLRMYLNNIFATGLPTGAPLYADPYDFMFRTRNYWRTDIGLFYVLTDHPRWRERLKKWDEWAIGLEIVNMFDRRNSVSNMWIREIYTKRMYGVPNYMVGRIFNIKVKMKF
ncbi:MAG: TonB-dependent receptor [Chlorobi bacterium]|nr:TonB-dependent receptor [Chlorobiota bacterium]